MDASIIQYRRKPAIEVLRCGQHADAPARRRDQCPRCRAFVPGPIVSAYQTGGVVAHHWKCECCDSAWDTFFQPLLV